MINETGDSFRQKFANDREIGDRAVVGHISPASKLDFSSSGAIFDTFMMSGTISRRRDVVKRAVRTEASWVSQLFQSQVRIGSNAQWSDGVF